MLLMMNLVDVGVAIVREDSYGCSKYEQHIYTTINSDMLGLLRRLQRLYTQFCVESQTDSTGIRYPRVEAHKKKDGHNKQDRHPVLSRFTYEEIANAMERGKKDAQETVEALGMAALLL